MALRFENRGFGPHTRISVLWILGVVVDSSYLQTDIGFRKTGCYKFTAGSYTVNMGGTTSCGGQRCPHCFNCDTAYGTIELLVTSCSLDIHTSSMTSLTGNILTEFSFSNTDRNLVIIKDGGGATDNTFLVTPAGSRGSRAQCTCNANKLTCDSSVTEIHTLKTKQSYELNFNCITVDDPSHSTLDFSTTSCNFKYCPTCIHLDTSTQSLTLTMTECSHFIGQDYQTTAVIYYTISNTGGFPGYVTDGVRTFTLMQADVGSSSSTQCTCYNDQLSCSALTVKLNSAPAPEPAIAYMPASLSVNNYLMFGHDGTTYAFYDSGGSNSVEFWTSSTRALTVGAGVGTLHGTWQADGAVGTSDSRLKKNIRNLQETLRELQQSRLSKDEAGKQEPMVGPAEWLLSQLRPVSFSFIADKNDGRRFGFIAEEVEKVFPELIRIDEADSRRVKRVLMMDFIALLWMALQNHQHRLEQIDRRSEAHKQSTDDRLSRMEKDLSRVETDVKRLSAEVAECRQTAV